MVCDAWKLVKWSMKWQGAPVLRGPSGYFSTGSKMKESCPSCIPARYVGMRPAALCRLRTEDHWRFKQKKHHASATSLGTAAITKLTEVSGFRLAFFFNQFSDTTHESLCLGLKG